MSAEQVRDTAENDPLLSERRTYLVKEVPTWHGRQDTPRSATTAATTLVPRVPGNRPRHSARWGRVVSPFPAGDRRPSDHEYLNAVEIGRLLRCSDDYAASLLKAGKIRGVNLGGGLGWRAHRDDVEAFVRGRAAAQAARPAKPAKAAK